MKRIIKLNKLNNCRPVWILKRFNNDVYLKGRFRSRSNEIKIMNAGVRWMSLKNYTVKSTLSHITNNNLCWYLAVTFSMVLTMDGTAMVCLLWVWTMSHFVFRVYTISCNIGLRYIDSQLYENLLFHFQGYFSWIHPVHKNVNIFHTNHLHLCLIWSLFIYWQQSMTKRRAMFAPSHCAKPCKNVLSTLSLTFGRYLSIL